MTLPTPSRKNAAHRMLTATASLLCVLSAVAQPGRQGGGYSPYPSSGGQTAGPSMGAGQRMGNQGMGYGGPMGTNPRQGNDNGAPGYGQGYPRPAYRGGGQRYGGMAQPEPQTVDRYNGQQQPYSGQRYSGAPQTPQSYGGQRVIGSDQQGNSGQRYIGPQQRVGQPVRGEHLGQWMQQHSNLNPQQQQRALQNEPGFNRLPPQQQQQVMNRLNRLNTMPQQQRERVIQRAESMERLSPQQRGDVRSAMGQLGSLPEDRRRAVARSFRDLRQMPVQQRNSLLNSPEYRQQFSDEERGTLGNLLSVEPLLPGR